MEKFLEKIYLFLLVHFSFKAQTLIDVYSENVTGIKSDCQSIMFDNKGDVDATINGYPLKVGDTPLIIGTSGFGTDVTRYAISFDVNTTGVNPQIWVVRQVKETRKSC